MDSKVIVALAACIPTCRQLAPGYIWILLSWRLKTLQVPYVRIVLSLRLGEGGLIILIIRFFNKFILESHPTHKDTVSASYDKAQALGGFLKCFCAGRFRPGSLEHQ